MRLDVVKQVYGGRTGVRNLRMESSMTVHHCPKCELRFNWKTEVDDHCWHDHPEFRHEYPAQAAQESVLVSKSAPPRAATPRERRHHE